MFSQSVVSVIIICLFFSVVKADQRLTSCLDDNGNPVDWYMVYKMPLLSDDGAPFNTGYSYAYITSENVKEIDPTAWTSSDKADLDSIVFLNRFRSLLLQYLRPTKNLGRLSKAAARQPLKEDNLQWTISSKLITDPQSMVLRTLRVAYGGKNSDLNSIYYNDNPGSRPKKGSRKNSSRAHAKGSVIIDEKTGDSVWLTHSVGVFSLNLIELNLHRG